MAKREVCRSKTEKVHGSYNGNGKATQPSNKLTGLRYHSTKYIQEFDTDRHTNNNKTEDLALFSVGAKGRELIRVEMVIENTPLVMEIDTGAVVSILSLQEFQSRFPYVPLRHSDVVLKTYTAETMTVVGVASVKVCYKDQRHTLDLIVVEGNGPALLGRDWLNQITLNWHDILLLERESMH